MCTSFFEPEFFCEQQAKNIYTIHRIKISGTSSKYHTKFKFKFLKKLR